MKRAHVDIGVGFFVILGVIAIVFLSMQAANLLHANWNDTYTVKARFDNIGGLKPKAAVRSAGVLVGRVDQISFDPQTYQAQVYLSIDTRYHFPKDTSAKILTSGLLGEQYIGLQPGYEKENWKAQDWITQTQSAVVLENLISQFLYRQIDSSANSSGLTEPQALPHIVIPPASLPGPSHP